LAVWPLKSFLKDLEQFVEHQNYVPLEGVAGCVTFLLSLSLSLSLCLFLFLSLSLSLSPFLSRSLSLTLPSLSLLSLSLPISFSVHGLVLWCSDFTSRSLKWTPVW